VRLDCNLDGISVKRETQILHRRILSSIVFLGSAVLGSYTPKHHALASSHTTLPGTASNLFRRLPISFEPNRGQSNRANLFLANSAGFRLALSRHGVEIGRQHPITIRFTDINANVRVEGTGKLPGSVNYLVGNVPARWHVDIPTYRQVNYRNIYPGIDLSYAGAGTAVEATWLIRPGADSARISMTIGDISQLRLNRTGRLIAATPWSRFTMSAPVAYQGRGRLRRIVSVHFRLSAGGHLSLQTGRYDHTQPLVVDPTLSYATNLGGSSSDFASGITVDSAGNSYVAGSTSSPDFPVVRAVQPREPGTTDQEDAFVTKLNPSGTALLFSTYLGGNNDEDGAAIALGRSGAIYVTGFTRSSNFPQRHPLKQQSGGCNHQDPGGDAFVVKLGPRGDTLLYSTCLGGSATDWGTGIAVDHTGSATITGAAASDNFPTANPYQRHRAGSVDAFVAKLAPGDTSLIFSTYLGGKGADEASGVALDQTGSTYIVGSTESPRFPGRTLAQPHAAGAADAFVVKLNPSGRRLVYAARLGGSGAETALGVAVDASGAAYMSGATESTDFPTVRAIQSRFGGGTDAFVTKVAPGGTSIDFSTYLGGNGSDVATAIAVDSAGRVHITGSTASPNFPLEHPLQPTYGGGYFYGDAFVAELAVDGQSLLYNTYLGGNGDDVGTSIAVDARGDTYITGGTSSPDFPVTREITGGRPARGNAFVVEVIDNPS
jgi:hypothetical protein